MKKLRKPYVLAQVCPIKKENGRTKDFIKMEPNHNCDASEFCTYIGFDLQRNDMDLCIPNEADDESDEPDIDDWLQSDPGDLDDILGTSSNTSAREIPIKIHPTLLTYDDEEDLIENDDSLEFVTLTCFPHIRHAGAFQGQL